MGYVYLAFAILAEIIGTTLLKMTEGFTKSIPSIGCVVAYVICYFTFSKCISYINLNVGYATWCGIGIVATTIIAVVLFKEQISLLGIIGIILIIIGSIFVNLFG